MLKEFKQFILRGNVIDLAVAVVIGAAFGRIVASLVEDIIMPPLGVLIGGVNFTELSMVLISASEGSTAVAINYGNFIQQVIIFLIVAFAIFLLLRLVILFKKKETPQEEAAPTPLPTKEELLLTEIRDILKQRNTL